MGSVRTVGLVVFALLVLQALVLAILHQSYLNALEQVSQASQNVRSMREAFVQAAAARMESAGMVNGPNTGLKTPSSISTKRKAESDAQEPTDWTEESDAIGEQKITDDDLMDFDPDDEPTEPSDHKVVFEDGNVNWPLEFSLKPLKHRTAKVKGRSCHRDYCEQWCDPACSQLPRITKVCHGEACGNKRVLFKANILYPIFSLTQPEFADKSIADLFMSVDQVKGWYHDCHSTCPSPYARDGEDRCDAVGPFSFSEKLVFSQERFQQGEVVVVKDGVWNGRPDDSFFGYQCWEGSMKQENAKPATEEWLMETDPKVATMSVEKAFVFLTPVTGGAFYQHFIDRGWSKLMQVISIMNADPEIKLIYSTVYDAHGNVAEVLKRFGFPESRIIRVTGSSPSVHAKYMLFSCVAPHYHPYTYQRAIEEMNINHSGRLEDKDAIVYLTRRSNSRRVLNEDEVLNGIRAWVASENLDLELIVFEHKAYPKIEDVIQLMSQRARFVIGPHGGAFYNTFYADPRAAVIEFFPVMTNLVAHRWPEAIWWPSEMLGQSYYQIPVLTQSADMQVPVSSVTDAMKHYFHGERGRAMGKFGV